MKPYFERGGIRIFHGDALEILPTLKAGDFDAVFTDPPFGVREEEWDNMDRWEFSRFSMQWLSQARRLAPELVTFCTQESAIRDLCRFLYPRVRQFVWHKPPGSQYAGASERRLWFSYEPILHCHLGTGDKSVVEPKTLEVATILRQSREGKGLSRGAVDMVVRGKRTGLCYRWEEGACLPTKEQAAKLKALLGLDGDFEAALDRAWDQKDDTLQKISAIAAMDGADRFDVFSYRTVTDPLHPCEKPVNLMVDLLDTAGAEWKTVLDPFCGTGPVLRAAKDLGREAIGIEIEEKYAEICARRLEQEVLPCMK